MRRVSRREVLAAAAILAALAGALIREAWVTGITVDEPSHVLSSILYWRGADNLKPRDMPPLIKLAAGWVPAALDLPLAKDRKDLWDAGWEMAIANEMVAKMTAEQARRAFFLSRLPLLVFPLLIAALVWWWGRQLFSPAVGLLLALGFAAEPTALGHGCLFKNDLAATFGYLLFWYFAWRYWQSPGARRALLLGAGVLVAVLAKMSMLVLLPVVPLLAVLRSRSRGVAHAALAIAIAYGGSLAAWQFDAHRLSAEELSSARHNPPLPPAVRGAAQVFRLLPVPGPAWEGAVFLLTNNAGESPIYLLGKKYTHGHPAYFLVALAVKSAVIYQVLALLGAAALMTRFRRKLSSEDFCWIGPGLLYIGIASLSSLQFGIRLILPALPFALLIAGAGLSSWPWLMKWPALIAVLLAAPAVAVFPHGISYFNLWAGGPENGLKYLADSNLDWGQDLPRVADYIRDRSIRHIRVSYFGAASPYRVFREGELEVIPPPWSEDLARGSRLEPRPGWYAISATLLPGHFFDEKYRDYYRAFRDRAPTARAGYSIYLYKIE